jgi:hypothetical protein
VKGFIKLSQDFYLLTTSLVSSISVTILRFEIAALAPQPPPGATTLSITTLGITTLGIIALITAKPSVVFS